MIKEDPHKLTKPVRPKKVDRWLTNEEIYALLAETQQTPHLHIATVLMLSTAGRIGAVLDLTWDRVDFDKMAAAVGELSGKYKLAQGWCRHHHLERGVVAETRRTF